LRSRKFRFALWLLLGPGLAHAAPDPAAIATCTAISRPPARLACYDALFGVPSDSAATASPQDRTASIEADFGLRHPSAPAPTEHASISARIVAVALDGHQAVRVTLDNHDVWLVLEDGSRIGLGDTVTIRKAAMSSYLMTTPDRHVYRVRRVS